ncbi:MAG TPA: aminoacyl-tRNA hydrolase [Opitutaceae bacterium]|nr:aminoacyl-tRNA hydrolase [Opitutaceae bacterium]
MSIAVLAGLGNPGEEYADTRHNLGWLVLDALASAASLAWTRDRNANAMVARWELPSRPAVLLVKPLTYVNESGQSLRRACDYLRHPPASVAVVYDDLTMPVGRLKISVNGSAGGHNGVQSLIDHLGAGFIRYRIGIGPRTPPQIDLKDFVLGRFPPADRQVIDQQLSHYVKGLELLASRGLEPAMNQLNRRFPSANDTDQAQV